MSLDEEDPRPGVLERAHFQSQPSTGAVAEHTSTRDDLGHHGHYGAPGIGWHGTAASAAATGA